MFKQSKTLLDLQILRDTLICCCSLSALDSDPGSCGWSVDGGKKRLYSSSFTSWFLNAKRRARETSWRCFNWKCWTLCSDFMCSFPEKILMKSVLQWTRGKGSNHIWWTHDLQRHLWWLQFTLKGSKHRWNHFHYNIKAAAVGLCRQVLKVYFLACKTWWWGKKMTFLLPNASAINKSLALNGKSHVTRRALKLTNLIQFLSWKFIITCTSSEKAFSASENPTGHLIWRTFPPHRAHAHLRCAVPSVCGPVCGGWRFLLRAGSLYPPLPAQAFTGARLAPARFADSLPTAHGIPWKESLRLESKRRWGSHSRSHQEEPTTVFHIGGDRKRPPTSGMD